MFIFARKIVQRNGERDCFQHRGVRHTRRAGYPHHRFPERVPASLCLVPQSRGHFPRAAVYGSPRRPHDVRVRDLLGGAGWQTAAQQGGIRHEPRRCDAHGRRAAPAGRICGRGACRVAGRGGAYGRRDERLCRAGCFPPGGGARRSGAVRREARRPGAASPLDRGGQCPHPAQAGMAVHFGPAVRRPHPADPRGERYAGEHVADLPADQGCPGAGAGRDPALPQDRRGEVRHDRPDVCPRFRYRGGARVHDVFSDYNLKTLIQ